MKMDARRQLEDFERVKDDLQEAISKVSDLQSTMEDMNTESSSLSERYGIQSAELTEAKVKINALVEQREMLQMQCKQATEAMTNKAGDNRKMDELMETKEDLEQTVEILTLKNEDVGLES